MITFGTFNENLQSREARVSPAGVRYFKTNLVVPAEIKDGGPQAFLIEQEANSSSRPHLHDADQFQLVTAGSGALGKHRLGPISVHYANRYTGYGPIDTDAQGLSYLTLRAVATDGVFWLPQPPGAFPKGPRRNLFSDQVPLLTPEALRSLTDCVLVSAIEEQPDGVAAWLVRMPPHASYRRPLEPRGGRFHIVIAGSVTWTGRELESLAAIFESSDEDGLELRAGNAGAEVVVLQFGSPTTR